MWERKARKGSRKAGIVTLHRSARQGSALGLCGHAVAEMQGSRLLPVCSLGPSPLQGPPRPPAGHDPACLLSYSWQFTLTS